MLSNHSVPCCAVPRGIPCCALPCCAACCAVPCVLHFLQIRKFQPKLVAIKDAGKVKQLQELIKDVPQQPEILVGDEGAVEVRQGAKGPRD